MSGDNALHDPQVQALLSRRAAVQAQLARLMGSQRGSPCCGPGLQTQSVKPRQPKPTQTPPRSLSPS